MKQYRKKPVVIEACQYKYPASKELREWLGPSAGQEMAERHPGGKCELEILTLEDGHDHRAKHVATDGDWIIRGVIGEFYACKPDIFAATYDPVTE
jgi:hypothetical protein